ncbi:hypothetical protein Hanom_Chr07g00651271 [Helianthus anomalus]
MLMRPDIILHDKSNTSERGSRKYDSRIEQTRTCSSNSIYTNQAYHRQCTT